jgi:uncharacterized membrane protein (DUF485 family)
MSSVATDQKTPSIADEATEAASAIENELPTYRAISKTATFSLLCGILASFAFANLFFLVLAVLAVVLGVLANLGIKRHPDMLTGRRLANAGIALGIIFGLVVTTYSSVQTFILTRDASQFGKRYAEVVEKGSLGDLLWYGLYPTARKDKTPDQALKEFENVKAKERMFMDQKIAPLQNLKKYLSSANGGHLHFVDIESHGIDHSGGQIVYYALALFEVEGSGGKDSPGTTQHALAIFKGMPKVKGRGYDWWVDDLKYPYKQKSYSLSDKPVDDGHGHPH